MVRRLTKSWGESQARLAFVPAGLLRAWYAAASVPIEPLRMVTDQWEWASIAKLVPTVYHEQSWTLASVTRIRAQTSLPVSFGYARVWVSETMVGCPLIRLGNRWFNTPRAAPLVLQGTHLNAAAALKRACARDGDPVAARLRLHKRLELHDDHELVAGIERVRLALDVRTASRRTYRAMSSREIGAMVRSLHWSDPYTAEEWDAAVRACWKAGSWTTAVDVHRDDAGDTIGYTVWVSRSAGSECVAAALVGENTLAWTVSR